MKIEIKTLGFIGLGVMGEPMCRNLATKSTRDVIAYDLDPAPLERLKDANVTPVQSIAELTESAELIFLSLPGAPQLEAVCLGEDGLLSNGQRGQTIVDTSTSPVKLTRELAECFAKTKINFADAPIARTREAARQGTLSIMVGASEEVYAQISPFLKHLGSEVTHCGDVGAGQVMKLMNNMVLIQSIVALSEALTIARADGVDGKVLFETLSKGSANSFALQNHGMKALLPGVFPERTFPTEYAQKDLAYALQLAEEVGIHPFGAKTAAKVLEATKAAGYGQNYFPALLKVIESGKI